MADDAKLHRVASGMVALGMTTNGLDETSFAEAASVADRKALGGCVLAMGKTGSNVTDYWFHCTYCGQGLKSSAAKKSRAAPTWTRKSSQK